MRTLRLLLVLLMTGCADPERPSGVESPMEQFQRLASAPQGLRFIDSERLGARVDGASCELTFLDDSRVRIDGFGYNILFANGSYSFANADTIEIHLVWDEPDWPVMTLSRKGGELLLHREDGETRGYPVWIFWEWALENFYPLRSPLGLRD